MNDSEIKAIVRIVSCARIAKEADDLIAKRLIDIGVPEEHAQALLDEVTHALKHGVSAMVIGADTSPAGTVRSPIYAAAFKEGQRQFRSAMGYGIIGRAAFWLSIAVVVAIVYLVWLR